MKNTSPDLRKSIASFLSLTLVLLPAVSPAAPLTTTAPTWVSNLTPANQMGEILNYYDASASSEQQADKLGTSAPRSPLAARGSLVVLIEDLHFNRSVQRNIERLIGFYQTKLPQMKVAVEGASGNLDYSPLTNYSHPEWKHDLVKFLIQNGEITGSEAFAIETNQPHLLTGVENEKYYQYNRELFRRSFDLRSDLHASVLELSKQLETLKAAAGEKSELAKNAGEASQEVSLIEQLLAQRVTEEEARHIARRLPQTLALIQTLSPALPHPIELSRADIQEAIQNSLDFYAAALLRNEPLAENTARLLQAQGSRGNPEASSLQPRAVVLIAGGFHAEAVTRYFKQHGISYIVVAPEITEHTAVDEALYVRRLLGRHVDEATIDREVARGDALGVIGDVLTGAGKAVVKTFVDAKLARRPLWRPFLSLFSRFTALHFVEPADHELFGVPQGASKANELNADQKKLLDQAAAEFKLNESDKRYLGELWRQQLYPDPDKQPLTIRTGAHPEANFILAANLTDSERRSRLGSVPYTQLENNATLNDNAKGISVTFNSLDGGIGENVGRLEWLKGRVKAMGGDSSSVVMGAKGTDLGFDISFHGQNEFVSVAEAKLLQLLYMARDHQFAEIYVQPLVNYQSRKSYETLFKREFLDDRAGLSGKHRTYYEVFREYGIKFHPEEMLMQADLPMLEEASGNIAVQSDAPRQTGGHGQWGVYFLWEAYKHTPGNDGFSHVRVFANGDNVNGTINPQVVGYLVANRIPIIKLTTAATPVDKKGGKDGVREVRINGKSVFVPDQMEIADAKAADRGAASAGQAVDQESTFLEAGQHGEQQGKQPFNTNIFYINEDLLHAILVDLEKVIGEDALARVISPTLIKKSAKSVRGANYIPLDGAIGVAIHNLNAFFQTSTDPRVQAILVAHGVDRLLRFVDVPRAPFFAPVKNTFDIWWQRHSDYYRFDTDKMALVESEPGLVPPEITLSDPSPADPKKDRGYWNELQNLVISFGKASTKRLKSLFIQGQVGLRDAKLIGKVEIVNETGAFIDLHDPKYKAGLKGIVTSDGLVLKNVRIVFQKDGTISTTFFDGSADEGSINGASLFSSLFHMVVSGFLAFIHLFVPRRVPKSEVLATPLAKTVATPQVAKLLPSASPDATPVAPAAPSRLSVFLATRLSFKPEEKKNLAAMARILASA